MDRTDVTFWLSIAAFAVSATLAIIKGIEFFSARLATRRAKIPLITILGQFPNSRLGFLRSIVHDTPNLFSISRWTSVCFKAKRCNNRPAPASKGRI
jgi:hypothetical protein